MLLNNSTSDLLPAPPIFGPTTMINSRLHEACLGQFDNPSRKKLDSFTFAIFAAIDPRYTHSDDTHSIVRNCFFFNNCPTRES